MNNFGPEEIARRKTHSDNKNDTDDLTFENDKKNKAQGEAAQKRRSRIYALEMKQLLTADDTSELAAIMKDL